MTLVVRDVGSGSGHGRAVASAGLASSRIVVLLEGDLAGLVFAVGVVPGDLAAVGRWGCAVDRAAYCCAAIRNRNPNTSTSS